jgi:hypothetical protein
MFTLQMKTERLARKPTVHVGLSARGRVSFTVSELIRVVNKPTKLWMGTEGCNWVDSHPTGWIVEPHKNRTRVIESPPTD